MTRHPIRFGIQTGQQGVEWSQMLDLWRKADAWGYDSLWNFDHFYAIFMQPESPCLEGWTTLAALAQATSRARVGTLVSGNTYRHPCVTAKMAATLDHVSGGRLNLGIGAGWFEVEHRAFGIEFKSTAARLAALDEACRIIKSMLTEERTTFHGVHYTVTDALGFPKPVQRPRPPIMIGGRGERVLLRIVAEHADILQVGARNVQNFSLLRRVGEVGKPVLLKRGMATTIQEWLLSAEYVLASGNRNVILCERGIRTFETATRFTLDLNAIPVVKRLSHLPILVDPSHGTGHWEFVEAMAMAGVAAGADGLIIEVHPKPEEALSDGPQSLKPEKFAALMKRVRRIAQAMDRDL